MRSPAPRLLAATLALGAAFAPPCAASDPEVDRLIRRLGSDDFGEREAAVRALDALGGKALPAVRRAAGSSADAEVRHRAARLVATVSERLRGRAEAAVQKAGGSIFRYEDKPGSPVRVNLLDAGDPAEALALLPLLGEVHYLVLSGTPLSGDGLAPLADLPDLRYLLLCRSRADDRALAHLRGLAKLEYLDLARTGVTDAGLEHVKGLGGLRFVDLTGTRVTASGAAGLRRALPKAEVRH